MKIFHRVTQILAALILAACASDGGGKPLAQQTFENLAPIRVNVASVDVQTAPPNVFKGTSADSFATPLDTMAERYFHQRFQPAGMAGALAVTIEEVQVTQSFNPSEYTAMRWFELGGADVYDIDLTLRLEHRTMDGAVPYGNTVRARQRLRIPEQYSIAAREKAQAEAVERLFNDIDQRVVAIVVNEMGVAGGV